MISLAVASVVIFTVIEVAPGDPASFMLGMNAQPETLAALRTELGLDTSKPERYFTSTARLSQIWYSSGCGCRCRSRFMR